MDYSLSKMFQQLRIIFFRNTSAHTDYFAFLGFILIDNRQIHHKNHGTLFENYQNRAKRGNL